MGPAWDGLSQLEVVCNAGPLIHLDEIGLLDLLADFQKVYVPIQVWDEVERHRPASLRSWVQVQKAPKARVLLSTFSDS